MRVADYDYELPQEAIAQYPLAARDGSRLMTLNRSARRRHHRQFHELPDLLQPGDVLILNDSKVMPARLRGHNTATGGKFELLLLEELAKNEWWAMLKPGKRARPGTMIALESLSGAPTPWRVEVIALNEEGHRHLRFHGPGDIRDALPELGEMPLPPYIHRPHSGAEPRDRQRYQTVYARQEGSVAAPTAGLHFTPELLERCCRRGIEVGWVTLHVGLGTFAPVKAEEIESHTMHAETYELGPSTVALIEQARREGRRVVAVGTTTLRVLESAAVHHPKCLEPIRDTTRLFVYPPYSFRVVDGLITNFHLPRSTLLMLVSAFADPGGMRGRDWILETYAEAIKKGYRFFSYGDAMLLT